MQNLYQVGQQIIGTERSLLVERNFRRITTIDIPGLESLKTGVADIIRLQISIAHVAVAVVLHQPDVGIARLVENGLESQRNRAAVGIVGKSVTPASILKKPSYGCLLYTSPSPRD